MRQIRCIIPDLPRVSALRVGSPADASDAPLQGGPILARLPPVPPHWSAVRSRSSAFQARDRSPRRPKLLARGSSRAVGSWRAGGGLRASALGAARLARQSGTRRGAPRSAAGPSRSSGPAACHRPAASGGSPRRRQGRRPRPPSGTAPQAGAALPESATGVEGKDYAHDVTRSLIAPRRSRCDINYCSPLVKHGASSNVA